MRALLTFLVDVLFRFRRSDVSRLFVIIIGKMATSAAMSDKIDAPAKTTAAAKDEVTNVPETGDPARRAALGTALTLLLRILSFGCTQWTLRVLDPVALGRASIRLELMLTTILFMSREGFRLALTRGSLPKDDPTAWNVAWLSVPTGVLVSLIALVFHLISSRGTDFDYKLAGILYCVATIVEGFGEPPVLSCLQRLDVTTRVAAEGTATLGKTMTLVICLQQPFIAENFPVTAFGVSQLIYATGFSALLYMKTWSVLKWPKAMPSQEGSLLRRHFHGRTSYLTVLFTMQGLFKHILTEGDKIVLTSITNEYDQGVYAMGSAYGGMAARILLQPMEENARLLWSRLSAQKPQGSQDMLELSFTTLVKLVVYLGLIFATIAVNYTSVLLKLLAGAKWGSNAEATNVLSAFCVYTALLALNGTTEAFVYGVAASGKDIWRLGVAHTIVGIMFAALATLLVSARGTVGLVAANGVAMILRSLYSLHFAAKFFAERQNTHSIKKMWVKLVKQILPHPAPLFVFCLSWGLTNLSSGRLVLVETELFGDVYTGLNRTWLLFAAQHVSVAIGCVLGLMLTMYIFEKELGRSLRTLFREKQE